MEKLKLSMTQQEIIKNIYMIKITVHGIIKKVQQWIKIRKTFKLIFHMKTTETFTLH